MFYLLSQRKLLGSPEISDSLLVLVDWAGWGHQRWRLSTSYRVLGIVAQLEASDCSLCVRIFAKYFGCSRLEIFYKRISVREKIMLCGVRDFPDSIFGVSNL